MANMAIDALSPESRISGMPMMRATTAASRPAARAAGKFGTWVSMMNCGSPYMSEPFTGGQQVSQVVAYAPIAMKAIWPKETTPEVPINM